MQKLGLTLKIMGWLFHIETPQPPPADRSAIEQAFTRTIEDQIIEDPAVLTQNKDFIDLRIILFPFSIIYPCAKRRV